MWSGQTGRILPVEEPSAELGVVTLGGDPAGVILGGERRSLPVYSPGGYTWRPSIGEQVLVLKTGAERECPCVIGAVQTEDKNLEPGEVRLTGGDSVLSLKEGNLDLGGNVTINGTRLADLIAAIVIDILSQMEG